LLLARKTLQDFFALATETIQSRSEGMAQSVREGQAPSLASINAGNGLLARGQRSFKQMKLEFLIATFNIWANRGLSSIGDDETLHNYELWLEDYSKIMLKEAKPIATSDQIDLTEFNFQLSRRVVHYSLIARQTLEALEIPARATRAVNLRRHGFDAAMDRHTVIVEIVERHAPNWRTDSRAYCKDSIVESICTDLDTAEIAIIDNWRLGKTRSLDGSRLKNWCDALDIGSKKLVTDQIRTSLNAVRKMEVNQQETGSLQR